MEEVVFSLNLPLLFALVGGVFFIYYMLLRKYIFFWFDPLLIYLIYNSFSIAFVLFLYFGDQRIKPFYLVTFLLSTVGLLLGLIVGSKRGLKKLNQTNFINENIYNHYDLVFDFFLMISIIITIGSNLLMLISVGTLPILSADPSVAKVVLYTGGWGLVRRIDLVSVNFIFSIALLKIFHPVNKISTYKKLFYWLSIAIGILILFTMGSKSSLVGILNSFFGVAIINLFFGNNIFKHLKSDRNIKLIKTFGKYFLIAGFAYMFLVIAKSGVETSAGNTFITRLVGSGDTFYFFYAYDLYDNFKLGPTDFIMHIINPILGFLRIAPYEYPLGAYMLNYAFGTPLDSFGPNAQHHIEGLLYFGKVGAFFYSFFLGAIIGTVRLSFLKKVLTKPNFLQLTLYITIGSIIVNAATEIDFFLLLFYDIIMFGSILFVSSLALANYMQKSKKVYYES
ncbi:O-antigen polymerase [Mucilaginibacter sp. E4BP6]|uniref:O-antigen polymerase n=1 Tax=Mucilaginibacter sp. E4BP6 TaxID=2723089 RepID=UPI0015C9DED3|nr:O-antigen polymerase [Mucilaginibacter sp. E4BP6]NYE67910.1 hypothetical protein [Mucilaginibacter sp. E4BP6]